jgi:hypothetical protein
MDDELQHLERAYQQDPADIGLARRLKALLLRSGKRDEVRLRYTLGFVCKVKWSDMAPTGSPMVRRCGTCKKDVHTALSYNQFEAHAAKGHCVSIEPRRLPKVLERLIDSPERGLTRAADDACLVEKLEEPPRMPEPARLGGPPLPIEPERPGLLKRFLGLFGA